MFRRAPVAFLWTLISFDFAKRVRGPNAPDLAIFALLSSWVARFVMQPTALHCTSTFGDIICRMSGVSPPRSTIATLFSAARYQDTLISLLPTMAVLTVDCKISQSGTGSTLHL